MFINFDPCTRLNSLKCYFSKFRIEEISIDTDDDDEPQVVFANVHNQKRNANTKHYELDLTQGVEEFTVFKMNNNNHPVFPSDTPPKKRRFDDYGEAIQ